MGGFEISEIGEIPLAPGGPLHRNEVSERADRGFHTVDTARLGALQKIRKGECGGDLREKIEFAMWSGQVDRPIPGNPTVGDR